MLGTSVLGVLLVCAFPGKIEIDVKTVLFIIPKSFLVFIIVEMYKKDSGYFY